MISLVLMLIGVRLSAVVPSIRRVRAWCVTLLVLGAILTGLLMLVSPTLEQVAGTGMLGALAVFWFVGAWVSLEAGLCEELLFRACPQGRLVAWLKSPIGGIVVTALVFSQVRMPELSLRGDASVDAPSYTTEFIGLWR